MFPMGASADWPRGSRTMKTLRLAALASALAMASTAAAQDTVPVVLEQGSGALVAQFRAQSLTGAATIDYMLPVEAGDMVSVSVAGNGTIFEVLPPEGGDPIRPQSMMVPSVTFNPTVTGDYRVRAFLPEARAQTGVAIPYDIGFTVRRRP